MEPRRNPVRCCRLPLLLVSALMIGILVSLGGAEPAKKDAAAAGERERPKMPEIKAPVLFNTPEADKILEALQVFPPDNPWNEDISKLPVRPDSAKLIASVGPDKP